MECNSIEELFSCVYMNFLRFDGLCSYEHRFSNDLYSGSRLSVHCVVWLTLFAFMAGLC